MITYNNDNYYSDPDFLSDAIGLVMFGVAFDQRCVDLLLLNDYRKPSSPYTGSITPVWPATLTVRIAIQMHFGSSNVSGDKTVLALTLSARAWSTIIHILVGIFACFAPWKAVCVTWPEANDQRCSRSVLR